MKSGPKKWCFWGVLILFGAIFAIGFYRAFSLTVTRYQVESTAFSQPLTIVQLSDLHGCEYGENNEQLIAAVANAEPDLILMTGDIINRDAAEAELEATLQLTEALTKLAPVYFSWGNHEVEYQLSHGDSFFSAMEMTGVKMLDQQYDEIELAGQRIRIGGIYGYVLSSQIQNGPEQEFMQDFTNTALPTILLCHMPEGLLSYGSIDDWDVDVVFSGHVHGGQIRLPLIGGLYDPETGWFPKYSKGVFQGSGSTVILSAGLGSSERIPRFNNPPELIVVSIGPSTNNS